MKKNLKVLHLALGLAVVSLIFSGCGNSKEIAIVEEKDQVIEQEAVAQDGEKEEVAENPEEQNPENEDNILEETEQELYDGMPVAEVTKTVKDIYEFLDYVETLEEPALLIYNENEGYVINMGEGEYYQLKKDDRIFEYDTDRAVRTSDTLEAGPGTSARGYIFEKSPDYSQYDSPHEVLYVVYFTEELEKGDYFLLTCYLDAPAE